jgi:PAS domain S-box-containing protein
VPAESDAPADRLTDTQALLAALALVVDDMPTAVAVFDPQMRLRHCNRTWRRISERDGRSPVRVVEGMHVTECVPGVEEWLEPIGRELAQGLTVVREALPITSEGRTTYWDVTIAPTVEDGVITGFVQAVADATERAQARRELEQRVEERTREVERRRQVADGLHEVLSVLNSCCPEEQVLDCIIRQARRLLDTETVAVYHLEQEGRGILTVGSHGIRNDLLAEVAYPTHEGFVADTLMHRKPLVVPDSSMLFGPITDRMLPEHRDRIHRVFTRYRALLAVPLVIGDRVWGALAMYYDEPRAFSEEEIALAADLADHLALAMENAELRESAETAAALDERARLARDLHDAVTQTLFSASLIAEVLPRLWDRDQAEGLRRLEQLQHLTRGALAEMRTLLLELRPAALEEAELAEVLRQLAEAKGTSGLYVEVVIEGEPRRLKPDVQVALYRSAQEALNNITKHAGATRAEVALRYGAGRIELSVDDNGAGFDPSVVGGEHMGLRIMRERADAIGAAFSVESTPGLGTSVSVAIQDTTEGDL